MPRLTPNLWFDHQALDAAEFYVSVFPNSRITTVMHYTDAGPGPVGEVIAVDFELDGQPFTAINGGPHFQLDEAFSVAIDCVDQDEVDHYWSVLTADGGEESMCGWLKDRFGLSWQVVPAGLLELVNDPDSDRASRATQAMYQMRKIDIAAVRAAADGG